jgi:hypothetical protein
MLGVIVSYCAYAELTVRSGLYNQPFPLDVTIAWLMTLRSRADGCESQSGTQAKNQSSSNSKK